MYLLTTRRNLRLNRACLPITEAGPGHECSSDGDNAVERQLRQFARLLSEDVNRSDGAQCYQARAADIHVRSVGRNFNYAADGRVAGVV